MIRLLIDALTARSRLRCLEAEIEALDAEKRLAEARFRNVSAKLLLAEAQRDQAVQHLDAILERDLYWERMRSYASMN